MKWVDTVLFGYRYVWGDGAERVQRSAINFVGATVSDDPVNKVTVVEFPTSALLAGATKSATANTLAKRGSSGEANFGGTCNFSTIQAAVAILAPSATFTSCEVDTLIATIVVSPIFQSPSAGTWASADQIALASPSGSASFGSGATSGNSSNSGNVVLASGAVAGTIGTSGSASLLTGAATATSGASGGIVIKTGNAYYGSGSVAIMSGDTTQNIGAGPIGIAGGNALGTGRGGSVALAGGGSSGGSELGGDITVTPGVGAGGVGGISLGSATPDFQDGQGAIFLADCTVKPTSAPSGGVLFYSFGGVLFVMDGAGNETQITP